MNYKLKKEYIGKPMGVSDVSILFEEEPNYGESATIKTLTEQWKERTLKNGYYYYESKEGVRFIAFQYKGFNYPYDYCYNIVTNIKKVLARVPEYDQFADISKKVEALEQSEKEGLEINEELKSENEELKKKLNIATKALEDISHEINTGETTCYACGCSTECKGCYCDDMCNEALKQIKEVK